MLLGGSLLRIKNDVVWSWFLWIWGSDGEGDQSALYLEYLLIMMYGFGVSSSSFFYFFGRGWDKGYKLYGSGGSIDLAFRLLGVTL